MQARKHQWNTRSANEVAAAALAATTEIAFEERVKFTYPEVTIRPMEVRTFMAEFH